MSEPADGGKQQPGPDHTGRDQQSDASRVENQDQEQGAVFSDPTAPIWADPTAPVPASPPAAPTSAWVQDGPDSPPVPPGPPGAAYSYGQQPAAPQPTPEAAAPASNPYAAPAVSDPYAAPAAGDAYAQQPPAPAYGQPDPYGAQYPPYGQPPYGSGAPPAPSNTSAIVLTILSGVSMLSTAFFVGVPSLIFGIMALTSNRTDPVGSHKKSKIGWVVYAVNVGLVALAVVAVVALVFISSDSGSSNFNSGY